MRFKEAKERVTEFSFLRRVSFIRVILIEAQLFFAFFYERKSNEQTEEGVMHDWSMRVGLFPSNIFKKSEGYQIEEH